MEDRAYQAESVDWLFPRLRGLLVCPAGGGKTRMAALAAARRAWTGCKIHWVANTIEQRDQAAEALAATPCVVECSIRLHCAAANPDVSNADILILDECHHVPSDQWSYIVGQTKPTTIVWGLTATPDHEDPLRNAAVNAAFPERFIVDRQRLLKAGHLVEGRVIVHDVDAEGEFDEAIAAQTAVELKERMRKFPYLDRWEQQRRVQWSVTQEFLYKNENRNAAIVRIAIAEAGGNRSVLLLVSNIEHGTELGSRIPGSCLAHSKMGAKARRNAISNFRSGTLSTLLATSLADEGLDVPRAAVLVLAAGGRSGGKLEQRVGRVLRPFEGKACGTIHDFADRGAQFAAAQARARVKVYERLGYGVTEKTYR